MSLPRGATDKADVAVVGSGPNGLAAAITLARAGRRVTVYEARETPGGGCRSAELTLPGFIHDPCSAIHPLGVGSPFFRDLPLSNHGLEWVFPPVAAAHPLDDGTAVLFYRSVEQTAKQLGEDARAYRLLMGPLANSWRAVLDAFLGPFRIRRPLAMVQFGARALLPATVLAKLMFRGERARAAFGGMAAHSIMPLEWPGTSAFGLMLAMLAHGVGWPMARGGSQTLVRSLIDYLRALGGEIVTGHEVRNVRDLQERQVLLDVTPRQVLALAGDELPDGYKQKLEGFRYGAGVFKVDYALDTPVPWRATECSLAGTVHLGGTLDEVAASEAAIHRGEHPQRPYVLLAQQSPFDPTRAPEGKHTVWAYCHVPNGSTQDMTAIIEDQIERFAPGFRSRILARHTRNAAEMHAYNPNYIGGDINGGVQDLTQLFTRPVPALDPYATPNERLFICSSSTPPGGGVHGMCGYWAAQSAMK